MSQYLIGNSAALAELMKNCDYSAQYDMFSPMAGIPVVQSDYVMPIQRRSIRSSSPYCSYGPDDTWAVECGDAKFEYTEENPVYLFTPPPSILAALRGEIAVEIEPPREFSVVQDIRWRWR